MVLGTLGPWDLGTPGPWNRWTLGLLDLLILPLPYILLPPPISSSYSPPLVWFGNVSILILDSLITTDVAFSLGMAIYVFPQSELKTELSIIMNPFDMFP